MADPQNTVADSTSAQVEQSKPTEFQPPEGKTLVDRAEYERNMNRLRGHDQQFGEFSKLGIKSPKDAEWVPKLRSTLEGRKLSMDEALAILSAREAKEAEGGTATLDPSSIEKILSERGVMTKDDYEKERTSERAQTAHERASELESKLLQTHTTELYGEKPTARDKYLIDKALKAELSDPENRQLYPERHPLRSVAFAPMDEKAVRALIEKVKKNLAAEDGSDMASIGKAAAKGKPTSTPAGSRASQGKPEQTPLSGRPSDILKEDVRRLSSS